MNTRIRLIALLLLLPLLPMLCVAAQFGEKRTSIGDTGGTHPLAGSLWSEYYHYHQGESVHLRLTLENRSDTEIVLENPERPVVDILFVDHPLRWSEDAGRERDLSRLVLAPRERYVIDWVLPPLPNGWYLVYGQWETPNGEVRLRLCYGRVDCPPP